MSSFRGAARNTRESQSQSIAGPTDRLNEVRAAVRAFVAGLAWQQWLVLFVAGILIITVEIHNHRTMWRDHHSGQTIWTDYELQWEILLYGLIMPIVVGAILGHLGRTAADRDRIAHELGSRQELMRNVKRSDSWQQMAEQIVATPGRVVAADRSWLLAQQSGEEAFGQVATWQHSPDSSSCSMASVNPQTCAQCIENHYLSGNRLFICQRGDIASELNAAKRYCLLISAEATRKAALVFDLPCDVTLTKREIRVMEDLGGEMALALDRVNLRALERSQLDTAQCERLRIARDLHDTVGQNVSYLRLKLEQLGSSHLASDEIEFQEVLGSMLSATDETYYQLRNTLETLRTTKQRPILESITSYATRVSERAEFTTHTYSNGSVAVLTPDQARQIAYIAREALNNVEKHSAATQVEIHLDTLDDEFRLAIDDNGKGFDPSARRDKQSFGISIMEERAETIGAELRVHSAPGKGTTIELHLPLTTDPAQVT